MSTCKWLDLETLGSWPVMPKISPDTEDDRNWSLRFGIFEATAPLHPPPWCSFCRILRGLSVFWTGNSATKCHPQEAGLLLLELSVQYKCLSHQIWTLFVRRVISYRRDLENFVHVKFKPAMTNEVPITILYFQLPALISHSFNHIQLQQKFKCLPNLGGRTEAFCFDISWLQTLKGWNVSWIKDEWIHSILKRCVRTFSFNSSFKNKISRLKVLERMQKWRA